MEPQEYLKLRESSSAKLTEEEFDAISGQSFELGKIVIATQFPKRLRHMAGEMFAEGKDEKARWLRCLAEELEKEAVEARTEYDRNYPHKV